MDRRRNRQIIRWTNRAVQTRQRQIARRARDRVARIAATIQTPIGRQAMYNIARYARGRVRNNIRTRLQQRRRRKQIEVRTANVAGTTHTTSRMIVRQTPGEQLFLRKMFKDTPNVVKYVNRFGFAWMGARDFSKTIWYSVCHLKFNNVYDYLTHKISDAAQTISTGYSTSQTDGQKIATNPASFIYIGKCTFNYEIYNPTNYIMTVYVYDLVCKHDTPYEIKYNDNDPTKSSSNSNSAPENCMRFGSTSWSSTGTDAGERWVIGDQTNEHNMNSTSYESSWNTVGMKPTDYMSFNTIWKVKGMKKIILPPASTHHHVVVFNPKKKLTWGNLMYPRMYLEDNTKKNGIAGLTQSTLFGFEGQIAANKFSENNNDNTNVGTLPGKLYVKCIRKINCYNFPVVSNTVISKNYLRKTLTDPALFTDLTLAEAAP
ncbi:MAG: capsid protein [Cressdnaviricota sp.]|nr:MAG: capsid protein [Cressdnaviricota sp.]